MAIVDVKFRNNVYQLETDSPERICTLAESVNEIVENIARTSNNATDTKIAFMASLMLQDQILSSNDNNNSQEQTENLLADTINNVSAYVNHLADKYEKS